MVVCCGGEVSDSNILLRLFINPFYALVYALHLRLYIS